MAQLERRFVSTTQAPVTVETRDDGKKTITGYGAVFYRDNEPGTEFRLWADVVERIDRRAFDRALSESHDARGLFNHDPSNLLGRVASGTMRLSVDDIGLRYEIDVPDTQVGRDVVTSIERGDLTGSSFSFTATRQTWTERSDAPDIRMIEDLQLYDTGPVTYPAYQATTAGTRSEGPQEDRADYEAFKSRLKYRQDLINSLEI